MTSPRSRLFRKLLVGFSAALLVGGLAYIVPESEAGRRGRGSVRHSSRSGARSGAHAGSRAGAARGSRTGARAGAARTGSPGGAAAGARAGGAAGARTGAATGARAGARGGGRRGAARGGYRAGRRDARYSAWKDARRDYYRFRTVNRLIRAGVYLATRPKYSTTVIVTGRTYYYAGGVYYVQQGSSYVVVSAPPGAVVYAVPTTTTVVYVGSTPYYYYGGTYYVATTQPAQTPEVSEPNVNVNVTVSSAADGEAGEPGERTITSTVTTEDGKEVDLPPVPLDDEQNYEVVAPPVGATVSYLPDEAREETVGGKAYLVYEDTYYRPFASDGETIYMVVENPRGAG